MVWLKASSYLPAATATPFQFQYGLIKSAATNLSIVPRFTFQFQYGLIKSLLRLLLFCLLIFYFNSNMVWLKEDVPVDVGYLMSYFNSNMVWLKDIEAQEVKTFLEEFQFQYGLIKSKKLRMTVEATSLFQFQYGLIKRQLRQQKDDRNLHFNSNMVWLKEDEAEVLERWSEPFQFQYGLIKREGKRHHRYAVRWFQFQYGLIKRMEERWKNTGCFTISIPIWFD